MKENINCSFFTPHHIKFPRVKQKKKLTTDHYYCFPPHKSGTSFMYDFATHIGMYLYKYLQNETQRRSIY